MEYEFIVNPKARSGMGAETWKMLEPELKKRHIPYSLFLTERQRDCRRHYVG